MSHPYRQGLLVIAVVVAAITPTTAGVSADDRVAQLPATGKSAGVVIQTFQFQPTPIEVKVGARVTWTNNDDIQHTVTSGMPESRAGRFDGTLAGKGAKFTVTFSQPGTYPYFCDRHQSMRGEIRVN